MKKIVDTGELESFLNDKSAKEMDIAEVIEEGGFENKEDPVTKRKYKVLNVPVKVNDKVLFYSPNSDAIKVLQKEWGIETKDWIGKKFQIKFYPKTSFGVTRTAILPMIIKL